MEWQGLDSESAAKVAKNNAQESQSMFKNSMPDSSSLGLLVLIKKITENELARSPPKGLARLLTVLIKQKRLSRPYF